MSSRIGCSRRRLAHQGNYLSAAALHWRKWFAWFDWFGCVLHVFAPDELVQEGNYFMLTMSSMPFKGIKAFANGTNEQKKNTNERTH